MLNQPNGHSLRLDLSRIHEKMVERGLIKREDLEWRQAELARRAQVERGEQTKDEEARELLSKLETIRFDMRNPPPEPMPIFSLGGSVIATAENIMVVQAKMKAGKSAAIGAMIASTMQPEGDCLWFTSSNPKGHAVLHFDTEQSRFDHHRLIVRSLRRAQRSDAPEWLYSYHVKGNSIAVIKSMLEASMGHGFKSHGGVHSVTIDGIGDICADVNDPAEANALVTELERLAILYKTVIVCVLHENHGSDSGKTRGHLGSQLARKAETNLRLEKDGNGVTVMFADTSRSVHISKENGYRFTWSDEQKSHVAIGPAAPKIDKAKAQMEMLAGECFENSAGVGLSWSQLIEEIKSRMKASRATAERCINKMTEMHVVSKRSDRYFRN